jgi:hypothetical protein
MVLDVAKAEFEVLCEKFAINRRGLNQIKQRINRIDDVEGHGTEKHNVNGVEDHGRRFRVGLDGAIVAGATTNQKASTFMVFIDGNDGGCVIFERHDAIFPRA